MARRYVGLALSLALSLALAGSAWAKSGLDGMQKWWNSPRMVSELKLKPAEKERLDQLFLEFRQSRIEYKGRANKAYLEIEAAFEKEPLDEARAKSAFHQVEQAKLLNRQALHGFMLEVRRILGQARYLRLKEFYMEQKTQGGK